MARSRCPTALALRQPGTNAAQGAEATVVSAYCRAVAEIPSEDGAPLRMVCPAWKGHAGPHRPPWWAATLVADQSMLDWALAEPQTAEVLREGPFEVREYDGDGCIVEGFEAPTRLEATRMALERAREIPSAHWVGCARLRPGAPVLGYRRSEDRAIEGFGAGTTAPGGRWVLGSESRSPSRGERAETASPIATDPPPWVSTLGCEGRPSAAAGHLERGCDSLERHIELLRQGFGISKVRSHLTELGDAELVRSEYGHREAAFR